jgi:hypothetical protein
MCNLIHMSDESKRLEYVNPNIINQIELYPQINESNPKYIKPLVPKHVHQKLLWIMQKLHEWYYLACVYG